MTDRSVSFVRALAAGAALWSLVVAPAAEARSYGDSSGSMSVGAGLSVARLTSDLTAPESFGTYELTLGYRPWGFRAHRWSRLSWELALTAKGGGLEVPASASYPADEASYALLWVGLRVDLLTPARSRWTPWAGVGAGLAVVDGREHGRSDGGAGAVWSAGADLHLTRGLMLRGRFSTVHASSLRSTAGSLGLVFEFLRPRHHRRPEWGDTIPPEPARPAPPPVETSTSAAAHPSSKIPVSRFFRTRSPGKQRPFIAT